MKHNVIENYYLSLLWRWFDISPRGSRYCLNFMILRRLYTVVSRLCTVCSYKNTNVRSCGSLLFFAPCPLVYRTETPGGSRYCMHFVILHLNLKICWSRLKVWLRFDPFLILHNRYWGLGTAPLTATADAMKLAWRRRTTGVQFPDGQTSFKRPTLSHGQIYIYFNTHHVLFIRPFRPSRLLDYQKCCTHNNVWWSVLVADGAQCAMVLTGRYVSWSDERQTSNLFWNKTKAHIIKLSNTFLTFYLK
jgi:hypothetical protein